ncbi:MAG: hypothetical protein HY801_06595 [Candidatus Lindowbacteria bacterium]|nr:hypothetical protein [Candidatus Lindowbacteria bacterium]
MATLVDEIREKLSRGGFLENASQYPERELIRSLLMLINDTDEQVRQRACVELGKAVSHMSESKIGVFIQRLLWRLNPESGDNPLGVPEALGEIGHRAPEQIRGSVPVILQYLEDEKLRPGLLQAAGRIGQKLPDVLSEHIEEISAYLQDKDAVTAGNAALVLARIGASGAANDARALDSDTREIRLFCGGKYQSMALRDLIGHDCGGGGLCFVGSVDHS